MKLVDVSKLQKIEIDHERYDYVRGCMEGYNTCIEDLETVPEVKAIPIEWIEEWVKTCIPHYDNDRMTYIADVYEMLEDWEEENETN